MVYTQIQLQLWFIRICWKLKNPHTGEAEQDNIQLKKDDISSNTPISFMESSKKPIMTDIVSLYTFLLLIKLCFKSSYC